MSMKWFITSLIAVFLVLSVISVIISYKDSRPVDGPLTFGYPLEFFEKTPGFDRQPVKIIINWASLVADILLIAGISMILAYSGKRLMMLKNSCF